MPCGAKRPGPFQAGVTEYDIENSLAEFIHRADKAMYMAKKEGRNRITRLLSGSSTLPSIAIDSFFKRPA